MLRSFRVWHSRASLYHRRRVRDQMKTFIFTQARVALALLFVSSVAAAQQPPEEAVSDTDDAVSEAPTPQPGDRLPAKDPMEEPPTAEPPTSESPSASKSPVMKTPSGAATPSQ